MGRASSETAPAPADHQQMDRSNDPEVTRAMDAVAPEVALASRRQRLTGSAVGVGSVGFGESGAFDVGAGESVPAGAEPETVSRPKRLGHPAPDQGRAVQSDADEDTGPVGGR
jgi:hypothetical protein